MSGAGIRVPTRAEQAALAKRRRGRNVAMLVALCLVSALLYAISMVKLGGTLGPHS